MNEQVHLSCLIFGALHATVVPLYSSIADGSRALIHLPFRPQLKTESHRTLSIHASPTKQSEFTVRRLDRDLCRQVLLSQRRQWWLSSYRRRNTAVDCFGDKSL